MTLPCSPKSHSSEHLLFMIFLHLIYYRGPGLGFFLYLSHGFHFYPVTSVVFWQALEVSYLFLNHQQLFGALYLLSKYPQCAGKSLLTILFLKVHHTLPSKRSTPPSAITEKPTGFKSPLGAKLHLLAKQFHPWGLSPGWIYARLQMTLSDQRLFDWQISWEEPWSS